MSGQMSLFDFESDEKNPRIELVQELKPIALNKDVAGARLPDLIPEKATLALTRGYVIRAVHVGRVLGLLQEKKNEGKLITREEIGQQLSMTWASAQSHLNVMSRLAVVDVKTRITPFGSVILHDSPHVDNVGLLWLLHYLLASDAGLVLWCNLYNLALQEGDEITVHEVTDMFRVLDGRWSVKSLAEKVPNELGAILRTYAEGLFEDLRLITRVDTGEYLGNWNTALIPPLVWLCCILVYRDRYYPGASSLEIPLLVQANYSPGRILRQNEQGLRKALDQLHRDGLLTVETRSGLDQVRFKREDTWLTVIARFLQGDDS